MTNLFEIAKTTYPDLFKALQKSGIKAVSIKNWLSLQSASRLAKEPKFSTVKVYQKIAKLKQHLKSDQASFSKDIYQQILHWVKLLQPAYQKWQKQQQEFFDDPLWWSQCFSKTKTLSLTEQQKSEKILQRLQKTWFLQGQYAQFSTLDLIHVYQTVMPVFSSFLVYAKKEFKKQKVHLSPDLCNAYQQYLTWFDEALMTEKQRLRNCLQGRLQIGLQMSNGSWDNLISAMQIELQTLGIFPQQPKLIPALPQGHLTPKALVVIRNIIESDGSEAEKKAFYALDYHRDFELNNPENSHPHYRFNEKGQSYFIPSELNACIPLKSTWYPWFPIFLQKLVWGEFVYATFFQHPHCQFLLAQERAFLHQPMDFKGITSDNFLHHPAWQENALCLSYLLKERQRTEQWLHNRPMTAVLFPTVITLLQNYHQLLQNQAEQWLKRQLMILKQVMVIQTNHFEPSEKIAIEKTLEYVEALTKAWDLKGDITTEILHMQLDFYQRYCPENQKNDSVSSKKKRTARDQFREQVHQAIHIFEVTNPNAHKLDVLKTQLTVSVETYDSVALRFGLEDAMKAHTLPEELNAHLQTILDQPQFSEAALTSEENKALIELKKPLSESLPILKVKDAWESLNENPFKYDASKLTQHGIEVKKTVLPSTDPNYPNWQNQFIHYTLRFLKEMAALPSWEAFVQHRTQITMLLALLMDMTSTDFTVLHRSLKAISTAEKSLTAEQWPLFKTIYLKTPIESLMACIEDNHQEMSVISRDAASYQSQKELAFLPLKPAVQQVSNPSTVLPTPTT